MSSDYRSPREQRTAPSDAVFPLGRKQLEFGMAEGLLRGQVEREWAKFKDCEFKVSHRNWDATWRNWIRKAADTLPKLGRSVPVQIKRKPVAQAVEEQPADPQAARQMLRETIAKLSRKMGQPENLDSGPHQEPQDRRSEEKTSPGIQGR